MISPSFDYELELWNKGLKLVAGADEVGRGSFAGPVVAAAVIFLPNQELQFKDSRIKINDSKKLNAKQRHEIAFWIKKNSVCYGIGTSTVPQINKYGIKKASEIAFRKAIKNTGRKIDYLLVDAFYIPFIKGLRRKYQLPIVHGDEISFSIAAASIIAKVYRDKFMNDLGLKHRYKKYLWAQNKGYGTKKHQDAIFKYGLTSYHRKDFVQTFLTKKAALIQLA